MKQRTTTYKNILIQIQFKVLFFNVPLLLLTPVEQHAGIHYNNKLRGGVKHFYFNALSCEIARREDGKINFFKYSIYVVFHLF